MSPSRRLSLPIAAALAVAAPAQRDDQVARIGAALDRARPPLLEHLRTATVQPAPPGLLALLCLAALHDGVPPDGPVLGKALGRLQQAELQQTYELSLRLLVMEAWPAFPGRKGLAEHDCKALLTHRHEGAFGYLPSAPEWDLSNTQYAALGLRAAASMEVPIERRTWVQLAESATDAQRPDGGFGYRVAGESSRDANPSMTAAGIAVLSICRQAFARAGRSSPELDHRIEKGWKWFEKHVAAIGDANVNWSYYFHYGLERAAILGDVEKIGGVDWYRAGAAMLLGAQRAGGGWTSQTDRGPGQELDGGRGEPVATAFAVLFLRRKFQKIAGPITPRVLLLGGLTAQSTDEEVRQCAMGLEQRGKAALPDVLKALRDDLAPRRRAAAAALRAIAGKDFGIDPERDPEHNCDALRAAELWYLQNR